MNDTGKETDAVVVEETPAPESSDQEGLTGIPAEEIQAGKAFAILSYALSFIGLPFFVVPLITRDNNYALYHAKQSLIIWLAGVVVSVVSVPLSVICVGVITAVVGGIALFVFNIIGLINASKGVAKPVPLIGAWGEDWFKGITKIAKI